MTDEQKSILGRALPKWSQMYTTGMPVDVEQAKEIIRRTDRFFVSAYGGNEREFGRKIADMMNMKHYYDSTPHTEVIPDSDWNVRYQFEVLWKKEWGVVDTHYVGNDWIACSFIGGPHGWCQPDGNIGFVDNVGKWPDGEDIYEEWSLLAKEFPFLDIGVTLMSGDSCEDDIKGVMSFRVLDGVVTVMDPGKEDVHDFHLRAHRRDKGTSSLADSLILSLTGNKKENALPMEWFEEWSEKAPKTTVEEAERAKND